MKFELVNTLDIRENDNYPGIRVSLKANYHPICVPLSIDITTGDVITPCAIEYSFSLLFDTRTINILAYNLETILAEKLETILSRSIANTRPRDFYDIYILYALRGAQCNDKILLEALKHTVNKRFSQQILKSYNEIIIEIKSSKQLHEFWKKYQRDFNYAKNISFEDTCNTIQFIMDSIMNKTCLNNKYK